MSLVRFLGGKSPRNDGDIDRDIGDAQTDSVPTKIEWHQATLGLVIWISPGGPASNELLQLEII